MNSVDTPAKFLYFQELYKNWGLEKESLSNAARLVAQNFNARLDCIAIWADRPDDQHVYQGGLKSLKHHTVHKIHVPKLQGVLFLR